MYRVVQSSRKIFALFVKYRPVIRYPRLKVLVDIKELQTIFPLLNNLKIIGDKNYTKYAFLVLYTTEIQLIQNTFFSIFVH
jgi:hypothetical protein